MHEHGKFSTCCMHINKQRQTWIAIQMCTTNLNRHTNMSNTSKHSSPQLNPSLSRSLSPACVCSLGLARSRAYSRALCLSRSLSLASSLALSRWLSHTCSLSLGPLSLSLSPIFLYDQILTTATQHTWILSYVYARGWLRLVSSKFLCEKSPTHTWLIFWGHLLL